MTRSENDEIVRPDLTDRGSDLELIERDFSRCLSQCLANDVRKYARRSISFRLLERPAKVSAVHAKGCLDWIPLQQVLGDPVRNRFQIRLQIETLERRELRAEIEGMVNEVVERFVEIPKSAGQALELYSRALLSLELRRDTRSTDRHVMMNDLVKTECGEVFSYVCPANFALVRIRLEMFFVRVGELWQRSSILESGNGVPDHKRLLLIRVEGARDDALGNIIARNDIESRIRIDARNSQMSGSKK